MTNYPKNDASQTNLTNNVDLKAVVAGLAGLGKEVGDLFAKLDNYLRAFQDQYGPQIEALVQSLAELPADFLLIQQALAERGWFVLAEMPAGEFRSLKTLINGEDFEKLDETMSVWTLGLVEETEDDLCRLFPHRETILREAFRNHDEGKYASAITLLLTQADGICHETLGEVFFKIKRNTDLPTSKFLIDELGIDEFTRITLHPILIKSGINASDKQISEGEFPFSPHRHPILHGTTTDYPSELNSLKIISFVGFMGVLVHKIVEAARAEVRCA